MLDLKHLVSECETVASLHTIYAFYIIMQQVKAFLIFCQEMSMT